MACEKRLKACWTEIKTRQSFFRACSLIIVNELFYEGRHSLYKHIIGACYVYHIYVREKLMEDNGPFQEITTVDRLHYAFQGFIQPGTRESGPVNRATGFKARFIRNMSEVLGYAFDLWFNFLLCLIGPLNGTFITSVPGTCCPQ